MPTKEAGLLQDCGFKQFKYLPDRYSAQYYDKLVNGVDLMAIGRRLSNSPGNVSFTGLEADAPILASS